MYKYRNIATCYNLKKNYLLEKSIKIIYKKKKINIIDLCDCHK